MTKKVNTDLKINTALIETLSHDGRGICSVNAKKLFINGALPGEVVSYHVRKKRSHYHEADAFKIIKNSKHRVTPDCEHFGICGGCSLQHMDMDLQIALKQQTLLDQLKHFGKVVPSHILTPLHVKSLGYRHKARLGVKFVDKKNKVLIGFREKASRYLALLDHCIVLNPQVGERFQALADLVASLKSYRHIAQIEVAIGDNDVALVFRHLEALSHHDLEKLQDFGHNHSFHIYLQPNQPEKISKLWPKDNIDRLTYTLPDYDLEYLFHPLDFTQINLEMNRCMIKQALTLLEVRTDEKILDLYCGIGNFTLPLARHAAHVVGVEGGSDMVMRAQENALHNLINNVSFFTANLDAPEMHAPWFKSSYDKIVLDPPRVGAQYMIPHLKQFGARRIVYVSCNPATLARDAGELVHQYGYSLEAVGTMNMFPHTAHIEAIALFT